MKILIVSDTHGHDDNFYSVLEKEKDIVLIVHLGDIEDLADYIEEDSGVPCYAVAGNNDYHSTLPTQSIIMLGKHRTFITHGHSFGVSYSTANLKHYAQGLGCDYVLYGHTHRPDIDDLGDVVAVNPGSLTYPRQADRRPSYIIAEVDDNGDVEFEIKYLS